MDFFWCSSSSQTFCPQIGFFLKYCFEMKKKHKTFSTVNTICLLVNVLFLLLVVLLHSFRFSENIWREKKSTTIIWQQSERHLRISSHLLVRRHFGCSREIRRLSAVSAVIMIVFHFSVDFICTHSHSHSDEFHYKLFIVVGFVVSGCCSL